MSLLWCPGDLVYIHLAMQTKTWTATNISPGSTLRDASGTLEDEWEATVRPSPTAFVSPLQSSHNIVSHCLLGTGKVWGFLSCPPPSSLQNIKLLICWLEFAHQQLVILQMVLQSLSPFCFDVLWVNGTWAMGSWIIWLFFLPLFT